MPSRLATPAKAVFAALTLIVHGSHAMMATSSLGRHLIAVDAFMLLPLARSFLPSATSHRQTARTGTIHARTAFCDTRRFSYTIDASEYFIRFVPSTDEVKLNDRSLVSLELLLSSHGYFDVRNPVDQSLVAQVPIMKDRDAKEIIRQTEVYLPMWRDFTTAAVRGKLLRKWGELIQENADDIATIMTLESGKPYKESLAEVGFAASFLDYYAGEAARPTSSGGGFMVPSPFSDSDGGPRGQLMAIHQAVGVAGMITPWNFPAAMITRKVAPAIAAGCAAIVKPSELTPMTAIALKNLANRAGIPHDVFRLVTASTETTPEVGKEMCENPKVRKISFTGSTKVGKQLLQWSSETVKRVSMELGGNAPFIVFEDADLEQAVSAAVISKFRNTGQTCVCADRFMIHESIYDEFCDLFVDETQKLAIGPGIDPNTKVGPMITEAAMQSVDAKVKAAIEDGAECLLGGEPMTDLGPQFYAPTLLKNVNTTSDIWTTETFGPVASIVSFKTEEEAIEVANDVDVGLAAYFCTKDLKRALRVSQKLESGMVGINEGVFSTAVAPFGGVKESGLGREGSPMGIDEYLETKYVFMNTE